MFTFGFPRIPTPRARPDGVGVPPSRSPPAPRMGWVLPPPGAGSLRALWRRTRPVGDGVPDVPRLVYCLPYHVPPTPARAWDNLAVYYAARGPFPTRRRGRRPRRPFPSSTADPTTFRQSTRRGRVPSPPGVRSPPALRCRRGCGRLKPPAKGEPPARVPPLTPSCASLAQESSARCGARPWAPPLDPARFFVKKRGKKLLLG